VIRAAALLLVTASVVLAAGCGGEGEGFAAKVGDVEVSKEQVEEAVEEITHELEREGKEAPGEGTPARERLERQVLGVLVERARLDQEAEKLGIEVDREEIEERLRDRQGEEGEGGGEEGEGGGEERFLEDAAGAQLVYEKLFARVTASVAVGADEVRQHYERNKSIYTGRTFDDVRDAIRSQLLAERRNAAMKQWLDEIERDYRSKTTYGEGFEDEG
jgi:SurA-like protein